MITSKYKRANLMTATNLLEKINEQIKSFVSPKVPRDVFENFRNIDKHGMDAIEASLKHNYFRLNEAYLSGDEGRRDLQDHLSRRLDSFRNNVIPWLHDAKPLNGSNILEIGCGTGSSTVALAEQGAKVTAIDILESSLHVARERCRVYGLNAKFINANATEVHKILSGRHFDFIIFFATLEHLTHAERMAAMKNTWQMLSKGDLWCVVETPNRLWFYDAHTSSLPFYHWLPDELAFMYSKFSPRKSFCDSYKEIDEGSILHFLRRGRGVSFHEFELSMDKVENLDIVSSLSIFLRKQNILRAIWWRLRNEGQYESLLSTIGPEIHRGFYQPELNLIIRKT